MRCRKYVWVTIFLVMIFFCMLYFRAEGFNKNSYAARRVRQEMITIIGMGAGALVNHSYGNRNGDAFGGVALDESA